MRAVKKEAEEKWGEMVKMTIKQSEGEWEAAENWTLAPTQME